MRERLPEFQVEPREAKLKEIKLSGALNTFVPLAVGNRADFMRYFWKERLLIYRARATVKSKALVDGEEGYEVVEEREGEGTAAELTGYYGETADEWVLQGEIFRRSDGILRVNTALQNGFPKILKKDEPYTSNGRRFELVGGFHLIIEGEDYPCLKVVMTKEYDIVGQKGQIEFYVGKDGRLLLKAAYHPGEEYSTVSYDHSVVVDGERFGILHLSILSSLLTPSGRR